MRRRFDDLPSHPRGPYYFPKAITPEWEGVNADTQSLLKDPEFGLEAAVSEVTSSSLTYNLIGGTEVSEVWMYEVLVSVGGSIPTFPQPGDALPDSILSAPFQPLTIDYAPLGSIRYLRLYPFSTDMKGGPFVQLEVPHLPPEVPVWTVDTALETVEGVAIGTARVKAQERGIAIESFRVQTKVGAETPSEVRMAFRTAGDVSRIDGMVLGPLEWEHDVILDQTRISEIRAWATLITGEDVWVQIPGFDRNLVPDILSLDILGTKAKCGGDGDTKSWYARRTDLTPGDTGYWDQALDGTYVTFNIPVPDSETWNVEITARSDVSAAVGTSTLSTTETRTVRGAAVDPSSDPRWVLVGVSPPDVGSDLLHIELQAASLPADTSGWSTRVWTRRDEGSGWGEWVDETAYLSPVPGAPSGTLASFTKQAAHTRNDSGSLTVLYDVRAEMLDSSGTIVDSNANTCGWLYSSGPGGREFQGT